MVKHIRCAKCRFAQQDMQASEYAKKQCGKCETREACEICRGCRRRVDCKARKNPANTQSCERRLDTVCSQQRLKWAAIQCTNPASEFYRALLNVSPNGDMLDSVTWSGCVCGKPVERGVAK
jgi:hypothetical protein